ncbi:uncharacterized protein [Dysidea avara]|uniref:uncharacterized protein n=1 Tax=Dysidea avara TaxID=196820 RepID=UPI00333366E6
MGESYLWADFSTAILRMSARGRRRLRLSSRKHYERDKYRKKKAIAAKLAAEDIDSTCKLSIPLMVINQAPSKTIEGLHNRLKIMQAIPDEWIDGSHDKRLCVYKLQSCAAGVEVSYCLTIKDDFSWHLYYRGQLAKCSLLHDVPKIINSVSAVADLLRHISSCGVCNGSSDDGL